MIKTKLNNQNGSVLLISLIVCFMVLTLAGAIMFQWKKASTEFGTNKELLLGTSAITEIANLFKRAWDLGRQDAACTGYTLRSYGTATTVANFPAEFCFVAAGAQCVSNPLARGSNICAVSVDGTTITSNFRESIKNIAGTTFLKPYLQEFILGIKHSKSAHAQSSYNYLPTAPAYTLTVTAPTCTDCTITCGAAGNADCFNLQICTDGSTCADARYIMYQRIGFIR